MKPTITPNTLAEICEKLPKRVQKRLEKDPLVAENWQWSLQETKHHIQTSGEESITIESEGNTISCSQQITCSCLLSPNCFHVYAVISRLQIAEVAEEEIQEISEPVVTKELQDLTPEQCQALASAKQLLAKSLALGIRATTLSVESQILRMIHRLKSVKLPRLSVILTMMYQDIQRLKEHQYLYDEKKIIEAMRDALLICHVLQSGKNIAQYVGVGRRSYEEITQTKLYGVFSLPIATDTGYAGVVTWLVDRQGKLWSMSSVRPGSTAEVPGYYLSSPEIGDLGISHKNLCRHGVFLENARAAMDGRLSASQKVKAVTAGSCNWEEREIAQLWQPTFLEQLDKIHQGDPDTRNFIFLRGTIIGATTNSLLFTIQEQGPNDGRTVLLSCPLNKRELPSQNNWEILRNLGKITWKIVTYWRETSLELLAIGPIPEDYDKCKFPEEWQLHCNIGLDKLDSFQFRKEDYQSVPFTQVEQQIRYPLESCQRRLCSIVLSGISSLPAHSLSNLKREAIILQKQMIPNAAQLFMQMIEIAQRPLRDSLGFRPLLDENHFAEAWLQLALYQNYFQQKLSQTNVFLDGK